MKRLVRRAATSLLTRILLIEGGTILVACIAMAELTPAVLTGGRTIEVSGADHPVMIRGNRGLLAMAITNLVDNARLHTPPGTTIELTLTPTGRISVADNGPGVIEEDTERLVRRFWRADHRRSDGAGLGLSIVQRIAHVHHGDLQIARSPSGGACFTLALQSE